MAAPGTTEEFLDLVRKSGVADERRLDPWLQKTRSAGMPPSPEAASKQLIRDGIITPFQAEQLLQGKWRRFTIGKYKVLEKLGSGGMGSVFLCEHKLMRRRVAVKVLPSAKAQDDSALQRFYREARAVAALDHPNIVHAYDIDKDDSGGSPLHFLVMEYVDGASLQELVKKTGPLDISRACHYIRQSALGLEHANQSGLIHRDIKPGNILVDRGGVVKILDMGLARFFNDEDDVLTKKFDENVLGTADYLAPEQATDSHTVDIRADIYGLGATFFYLLTGRTIFGEGTVAQKLMWHLSRQPKLVSEYRPEVPASLAAIVQKMLAKQPEDRYQTPAEVAAALEPFTQGSVSPPSTSELPVLSPAASGQAGSVETVDTEVTKREDSPPPAPAAAPPKALQGMSAKAPTRPGAAPSSPMPAAAPRGPGSPSPRPSTRSAASARGGKSGFKEHKPAAPPGAAKQTAAPAAPAAVQTLTPPDVDHASQESAAPWENLESSIETQDHSAKADTAPQPASVARRLLAKDFIRNKRRAWRIFGGIAIGVGGALVTLITIFAFRGGSGTGPRLPLEVTQDGRPNTYKSILLALLAAQPGDVIHLMDPVHHENLFIQPKLNAATDVTVRPAPGKEVVWKPARKEEKLSLLTLQHAANFKLKGPGLTLDGTIDANKRVDDLVMINFRNPGVAIEDVAFKNFAQSAISVINVWGSKERPLRLVNLTASAPTSKTMKAAIFFDAKADIPDPPFNDYMEVGPIQAQGMPALHKENTVVGSNIIWR